MTRKEFPNLAIVHVVLKQYCKHYLEILEQEYPTPDGKLEAIRNMASDEGNEEVVDMCDYIERMNLTETFFPR